jgi:hypothetical protein
MVAQQLIDYVNSDNLQRYKEAGQRSVVEAKRKDKVMSTPLDQIRLKRRTQFVFNVAVYNPTGLACQNLFRNMMKLPNARSTNNQIIEYAATSVVMGRMLPGSRCGSAKTEKSALFQ